MQTYKQQLANVMNVVRKNGGNVYSPLQQNNNCTFVVDTKRGLQLFTIRLGKLHNEGIYYNNCTFDKNKKRDYLLVDRVIVLHPGLEKSYVIDPRDFAPGYVSFYFNEDFYDYQTWFKIYA